MSVGSTELDTGVGSTEPVGAQVSALPTPERENERRRRLCRRPEWR
jgi:hypothetical protein